MQSKLKCYKKFKYVLACFMALLIVFSSFGVCGTNVKAAGNAISNVKVDFAAPIIGNKYTVEAVNSKYKTARIMGDSSSDCIFDTSSGVIYKKVDSSTQPVTYVGVKEGDIFQESTYYLVSFKIKANSGYSFFFRGKGWP